MVTAYVGCASLISTYFVHMYSVRTLDFSYIYIYIYIYMYIHMYVWLMFNDKSPIHPVIPLRRVQYINQQTPILSHPSIPYFPHKLPSSFPKEIHITSYLSTLHPMPMPMPTNPKQPSQQFPPNAKQPTSPHNSHIDAQHS